MVIVDTNVWLDFFKGAPLTTGESVGRLIRSREAALVGVVLAELIRAARSEEQRQALRRGLGGVPYLEMGRSASLRAGRIAENLDRHGTPVPQPDVFICHADGEPCGFAAIGPDPNDPNEAIMGVWLVSSARRKGIGRELALMATDFARRLGYAKLRGTLPKDNEPALSFFSDIGRLATIVGQGMQYELP